MSSDFAEFAEAASQTRRAAADTPPKFERVAVLGGGDDARLFAALSLAQGCEVTLFSAYGSELDAMRASSGIALRGDGPIGTYQFDRADTPSIRLTAQIDAAVKDADLIFLTGPIHKQRTYAMVLADHLKDGQVVALCPGRSLGALETAWYLRIGGATADIAIVEVQGAPFWFAAQGAVLTLSEREPAVAATLPRGRPQVLDALSVILPNIAPCESVLTSGFADGSALVEFPALLMGGPALASGAIQIPMGGAPLPENETFASLIGPEQRSIIEALAAERHAVAARFGVRDLPDAEGWINQHAGALKGRGRRAVPALTEAKALLRDGVIGSFVPLISAAELASVDVPVSRSMVTLASSVLGADIASAGRRLDTIGIRAADIDAARSAMDAIATGAR
ncbi:MAG: hypothetical protein OXR62_04395 [Ahrensia sp.]|nr:hypothetical protein [Ahrensia sp.]